jgi:hypothetical protein
MSTGQCGLKKRGYNLKTMFNQSRGTNPTNVLEQGIRVRPMGSYQLLGNILLGWKLDLGCFGSS